MATMLPNRSHDIKLQGHFFPCVMFLTRGKKVYNFVDARYDSVCHVISVASQLI